LDKFGVSYSVDYIPGEKSWIGTTRLKPEFIKERMLEFNRDVVWIDADAELVKPPDLLATIDADIGIYIENNERPQTGFIFFRNNDKVIKFIDVWIWKCKRHLKGRDDHSFPCTTEGFYQKIYGITITNLPRSYCQIFDINNDGNAVVLQHQLSRIYRKKV
jgi:hypothetical protein